MIWRRLPSNWWMAVPRSVRGLPLIHKDPFDHILIAQAAVEEITLLMAEVRVGHAGGAIVRPGASGLSGAGAQGRFIVTLPR
jgi:hypothetical protein